MVNTALHTYAQNSMRVESSEKLIEMLYEGILRFCGQAKKSVENNDVEKRVYWINRVNDIFFELLNSLDVKSGGQVAEYLQGLYSYQIQLMTKANVENTYEPIDTVINVVRGLLEAWREEVAKGYVS